MPKPPDTNPQPRSPAPQHDPVFIWPTPSTADYLFYVEKNGDLPKNKTFAYGDAHPDTTRYPDHKLVFVSPQTTDKWSRWFYASDRINQEDYNWEFSEGKELIRTYLVRRTLYYARTPAEAAAAVPLVTDEFTRPVVPTLDTRFAKYGFADDTVVEAPEELKGLFIIIRRRYLEPVVVDIRHEDGVDIRIRRTETLVPAETGEATLTADSLGVIHELKPVNTFHSLHISEQAWPAGILNTYAEVYPYPVELNDLPRELESISVVWNSAFSIGTQDFQFYKVATGDSYSLSGSGSDQASSSASLTADIQPKWRDLATGNQFGTRHVFFLPNPVTEAAILGRLADAAHVGTTVTKWPVFKPVSEAITVTGQGIKISCNASAGIEAQVSEGDLVKQGWDTGVSDDYAVSLGNNSIQLPSCIHGAIVFDGDTSRTQPVAATATIEIFNSLVGTINATKTKVGTAYGNVSPTTLSATSGQSTIPTSGYYLMDSDVRRYKMGYSQVTALVFNAANLA